MGLDYADKIDFLNDGETFSKTIKLNVRDNVESRSYDLVGNLYTDDGKIKSAKKAELRVSDCGTSRVMQLTQTKGGTRITGITEKTDITSREVSKEKKQEVGFKNNKVLLVLSTFIFANFFVFLAVMYFFKKKIKRK